MYRNDKGLFYVLESILKAATGPMTCTQIYDESSEVRNLASSPNRVSDYLGGLWRKGQVTRSPAPKINSSSARWAYSWKQEKVLTSISEQIEYHKGAKEFVNSFKDEKVFSKPGIEITEQADSITIELPGFIITVRKK